MGRLVRTHRLVRGVLGWTAGPLFPGHLQALKKREASGDEKVDEKKVSDKKTMKKGTVPMGTSKTVSSKTLTKTNLGRGKENK